MQQAGKMQIRACHPPSPGSHWASRGSEDKSPSSLSLQTSSTSLLPSHPHKGLPVSSAAPSSCWLRALVPPPRSALSRISPRCSSSLRLTQTPRSGRPPSGPSDPPWALTSHHGSHRTLWAHLRPPLLCIHLRAQFPALSSPWRSAREARSLAHGAAGRTQGCASLAVRCSMQHACVWWASQLLCSLCSSRLPGCGGAERPRASCSEQRRSSVLTSFDFVIRPSRPSPEMQETPSHSLLPHTTSSPLRLIGHRSGRFP